MPPDPRPDLAALQALYDSSRYLDAYVRTEPLWGSTAVELGLTFGEVVLASRLAARLGGERVSRALARHAATMQPDSPFVRFYCDARVGRRDTLYRHLRDFLARPELESGDPATDAAWIIMHAALFASVRDFATAHRWADRATELAPDDGFVLAGRSSIASEEDRRQRALDLAERAWSALPGHPACVDALANALAMGGSVTEAANRLVSILDDRGSQSYEVHLRVLGLLLAEAARSSGEERVRKARDVLARIPALVRCAMLADKACTRRIAWVRAEAARVAGDRGVLSSAAREVGYHFHEVIAKNLEANPDAELRLIPHPAIRQMHDTCLPASAATCLGALGLPVDHETIAQELTYGGTSPWRVARWAEGIGCRVRHFIVDGPSTELLVRSGIPFIITFTGSEFGHACAVVGIDFATRTVLVHDPSRAYPIELLLDELEALGGPLGPQGLVIVPPDRHDALDDVALRDEPGQTARVRFLRDLEERGIGTAALRFEAEPPPASALTEYLAARLLDARGSHRDALVRLQALHGEFPDCPELLSALVNAAYNTRDATTVRTILGEVAERGRLPGVVPDARWREPPPVYRARYADALAASEEHREKAHRLLLEALARAPASAECYHTLGDLLWEYEGREAALLPLRLASALAHTHEHYALAYAHALWKVNRAEEGIAWLRARVEHAGKAADAGPILSLVETLLLFGRPVEALRALEDGCAARPNDGALAARAAREFARYGRGHAAARCLECAERDGTPADALAAAAEVARIEGRQADAHALATRWVEEHPTSMRAREVLLDAIDHARGRRAAVATAREWLADHPDDDAYETLLLERLDSAADEPEREERLRRWVARDPLHGWAWRELALLLLDRVRRATGERRRERLAAYAEVADRCLLVDPRNPTSQLCQAELARLRGDVERAIFLLRECVLENPSYGFALRRLLEILAERPIDERRRQVAMLRDLAQGPSAHDVTFATTVIGWIARSVGFDAALACLEQWSLDSPDEASLTEAWADLHLEHASGRGTAQQVVERLRGVVERYPLHVGLRQSLAAALRTLGEHDSAIEVYAALVRDFPDNARCRLGYAERLGEAGRGDAAIAELVRAIEVAPRYADAWHTLADRWVAAGDRAAAIGVLERACSILEDDVDLLAHLAQELVSQGRVAEAVARVRAIAQSPLARSEHWILLARVLRASTAGAGIGEIEQAFACAVELDPSNWEAAREYCATLCLRQRWDDARAVMHEYMRVCDDPTPALGQLAAIARESGDPERGTRELRTLLQAQPDYRWGWQQLMEWTREDGKLGIAREALTSMGRVRVDPSLQADGLELLAHFHLDDAGVRQGWLDLVSEHPSSTEVALRAFDYFLSAGDRGRAETILLDHHRHRPYTASARARLVQLRCVEKDRARALDEARQLWRTGAHDNDAPAGRAMASLRDAGFADAAGKAMRDDLQAGTPVMRAMAIQLVFALRMLGLTQDVARLVKVYAKLDVPHAGEILGFAFDAMCQLGRPEAAISFRATQPTRAASDPDLWAAVAQAYYETGRYADVRAWMASWEQRSGVTMWCVAMLVRACMFTGAWADARRVGESALARLPRDQSTTMVVSSYLVALLRCEDEAAFVRAFEQEGMHLDPELQGELTVVCLQALHALLGGDASPQELRLLDRHIGQLASASNADREFLVQLWRQRLAQRLGGWRRVARAFGLW